MPSKTTIQYLRQDQIDRIQWDACLSRAGNGLIYGYSWYLDQMAGQWDGLILGDYQAVMPLPWRKKYGIYYLYQPFLTAQLGIFGERPGPALVESFLDAIPSRFRLWEFSLNHANHFSLNRYNLQTRTNYVLGLDKPYETVSTGYRENIRRNIRKSAQYGNSIKKDIPLAEILELSKQQNDSISERDYENFRNLYPILKERAGVQTYGVYSARGRLLASALFTFSHNRAYYILVGNHPDGRTLGASHALIDAFIRDHAGKHILLDFEGSDLRNLAFFYSSFGAKEEMYAAIRRNRLPWWMKWIKG